MALEGAAVAASATFGCSAMGVAVYSNLVTFLKAQREKNEALGEDAPDCAARIIDLVAKTSRQVCETPELLRAAFTDPLEELRKAGQEPHMQLASRTEYSVHGAELLSGYATFDGEVLKVGQAVSAVVPLLAVAGAQVERDGKTLTVIPKQAPALVLQLEDEEQAEQWQTRLGTASNKHPDPVDRLDRVVSQAHELMKHLSDLRAQMKRPARAHHSHKSEEHGHGNGHGHGHGHGHCEDHDHGGHGSHGDGHGSPSHGSAGHGAEHSSPKKMGAAPPPARDTHAEELEETKHLLVVAQCRESALQQQVAGLQAELAAADKAALALKAELDLARHQADGQELSPSAAEHGQDPAVVKLKMKMHTAQEVQATAIGELQKELQSSREELEMERSERAKQTVLVSDLQKKLRKSEEDLRFYRKQEAELRGQQRERKLSSQEVQAMRAHLQSLQRRSQEEEPSGEAFEKQLKEMTRKIKDSSPSRSSPARSHRPVLDQLEQAAEASLSRSEKSPKPGSDRSPSGPAMSQRSQVLHSPLRRPSTVALAGAGDLHSTESAQTLTFEDFKVLGPPQPQLPAPTQVLAAPQPQRHVLAPPQALPLPTPAETLSSNMFLAPSQGLSPEPTLGGLPFWLPTDLSAQPFAPVLETPPHASSVHLPVGSPSNFSGQLLAPASNGPMLGSWLPTTSSRTAATPERPSSRLPPNRASPARLTRAQAGTRLAGQGLSREPIVPI